MKDLRLAPHVHSAASDDSDWALDRLAATLRRAGFHGALVCDHDRALDPDSWKALQDACDRVGDTADFLLVPGVEYQDAEHVVHLPVYGRAPFYGRSPHLPDVVHASRADGGAAVFAHPGRRDAWRQLERDWVSEVAAIEVWNRKYDGLQPNTVALAYATAKGITPFAALDWHGPRQLFPLALRVRDPGSGDNKSRSRSVVDAILAREVRTTVLNRDITQWSSGLPARALGRAEEVRKWAAPHIRTVERRLGRSR